MHRCIDGDGTVVPPRQPLEGGGRREHYSTSSTGGTATIAMRKVRHRAIRRSPGSRAQVSAFRRLMMRTKVRLSKTASRGGASRPVRRRTCLFLGDAIEVGSTIIPRFWPGGTGWLIMKGAPERGALSFIRDRGFAQ